MMTHCNFVVFMVIVSVFRVFLVAMWKNTDQKNSEYGHFSHSDKVLQNIFPKISIKGEIVIYNKVLQ